MWIYPVGPKKPTPSIGLFFSGGLKNGCGRCGRGHLAQSRDFLPCHGSVRDKKPVVTPDTNTRGTVYDEIKHVDG